MLAVRETWCGVYTNSILCSQLLSQAKPFQIKRFFLKAVMPTVPDGEQRKAENNQSSQSCHPEGPGPVSAPSLLTLSCGSGVEITAGVSSPPGQALQMEFKVREGNTSGQKDLLGLPASYHR